MPHGIRSLECRSLIFFPVFNLQCAILSQDSSYDNQQGHWKKNTEYKMERILFIFGTMFAPPLERFRKVNEKDRNGNEGLTVCTGYSCSEPQPAVGTSARALPWKEWKGERQRKSN